MIRTNLKNIMQEKGVTIIGLGERTGLSTRTIRHARSDQIMNCRLSTLATIAAALGVRTKDLYEEE